MRSFQGSTLTVLSCWGGEPGVVGEVTVDLGFVLGVGDEQDAEAAMLGSRERAGEEQDSLLRERVHERGVLVHRRFRIDSAWTQPGPASRTTANRLTVGRSGSGIHSRGGSCRPAACKGRARRRLPP